MTSNDSKSYLGYLNILIDQHNNNYHRSIGKELIDADRSNLTEKVKSSCKAPGTNVGDKVMITNYKSIFSKGCTKNWSNVIL